MGSDDLLDAALAREITLLRSGPRSYASVYARRELPGSSSFHPPDVHRRKEAVWNALRVTPACPIPAPLSASLCAAAADAATAISACLPASGGDTALAGAVDAQGVARTPRAYLDRYTITSGQIREAVFLIRPKQPEPLPVQGPTGEWAEGVKVRKSPEFWPYGEGQGEGLGEVVLSGVPR
eukprot:Hpha_TRINITY_DN19972_c0_g1::TRINITY_DN19972_c0_g1_i1::g.93600::m.93600